MKILETVARVLGLKKVMLTVFTMNTPAMTFYNKFGYIKIYTF